ncbi:MAG: hypothetical protein NTV81_00060 [Candidatus Komeilibacteria bacterium]|nr:hypothetical protein [Candidatus Komeilibacteria bacterium]
MTNGRYIITAAGGNATAIQVLQHALARANYEDQGRQLQAETDPLGAEQYGFLIPEDNHFEMASGEFCGNAARAAAIVLANVNGQNHLTFTMSGFSGKVEANVDHYSDNHLYRVNCAFQGMEVKVTPVTANGQPATLVDLGGIVHVVIEGEFSAKEEIYKPLHRKITEELDLTQRDAVGVVWITKSGSSVIMHPVVWVRAIDSFFYEGSCGSGTIAVGKITGVQDIVQPTGKIISVRFTPQAVNLESEMEVTHGL